jgi:osmoprotectant transport system permease protein
MRRGAVITALAFAVALCAFARSLPSRTTIVIASKQDTEGQILAEILAELVEARTHYSVERKTNLGGTLLVFTALQRGAVDVYPEYTGTIDEAILHESLSYPAIVGEMRNRYDMYVSPELGFNNTYAVTMKAQTARLLRIRTISDLASHRNLRWGVSPEFLHRSDGLPGLERAYRLGDVDAIAMEHSLAYPALEDGAIAVTDAYSTDGELLRYEFVELVDDRHFFPPYRALYLARQATVLAAPELRQIFDSLAGAIDARTMTALNAQVDVDHQTPAQVASRFLTRRFGIRRAPVRDETATLVLRALARHVELTVVAVLFTIILGLPLGLWAAVRPRAGRIIMKIVGTLQTIPSLALLALMIPLFGIGVVPALVALVLYGLLPVVANTVAGLRQIPSDVLDAARGIGLTGQQSMAWIQLPLALPFILAGIRTSAVIAVGTATIAAFIGAGGLGDFIITGLTLNDPKTILLGAVPAALIAIGVEELIYRVEVAVRPHGFEA